jgi:hypothetical protein
MDDLNIHEKPKETAGDAVHTLARAGLSMIPLVGGPAVELLSTVITPPIIRRRDEWIVSIAAGLQTLAEKVDGFKIEDLSQNDVFITTVLHASQVAIRNHQKEKLRALRSAVLHTAMRSTLDDDLQLIFLGYIDTLSPLHLRILRYLDDPQRVARANKITFPDWETDHRAYINVPDAVVTVDASQNLGSVADALIHVFPELRGKNDIYTQIGKELYDRGLSDIGGINHGVTHPDQIFISHSSALGKQFIAFITSPIDDDDNLIC